MTPRLTNATMLVLAWAAGACASMHSVLLSTQVSCTCNHMCGMLEMWAVVVRISPPRLAKLQYDPPVFVFFNLQPYWRNWRNVSLFALCIFLPTWRSVWARASPHCPPTSMWYFRSVSPTGCSSPLYARCLTLCCVNTTRALRSVSRYLAYYFVELYVIVWWYYFRINNSSTFRALSWRELGVKTDHSHVCMVNTKPQLVSLAKLHLAKTWKQTPPISTSKYPQLTCYISFNETWQFYGGYGSLFLVPQRCM